MIRITLKRYSNKVFYDMNETKVYYHSSHAYFQNAIILGLLSLGIIVHGQCPRDMEQFGSKCYKFHKFKRYFEYASDECTGVGQKLVEPQTSEENDFIKKFGSFWLGHRYQIQDEK